MAVYDDQRTKPDAPLVPDDNAAASKQSGGENVQSGAVHDIADREKLYDPSDKGRQAKSEGADSGGSASSGKQEDAKTSGGGETASEGGAAGIAGAAAGGPAGIAKKLGGVFFGNRKRQAASGGGIVALILTGFTIFNFTLIQGPLQFVHAAELLTGFHFASQSNFSDKRSAKFVIYALAGKAAKGRLGVIDNKIADRMETKLHEESGLRSVYSSTTQRLIGYEVLDETKAGSFLNDMEKDGIPRDAPLQGKGIDGKPLTTRGVNFENSKFSTRRSITRTAVRSTGVNKITGAITSRLLKKRGGVGFHPLKLLRRPTDQLAAKWDAEQRAKEAAAEETGITPEGVPDTALKEKRVAIKEKLQSLLKSARGPLFAVIGVCAVKGFSDQVDVQNLQNQMQLIRVGMSAITIGSQVKSGQDFDPEQLGALNAFFYDPKTGTSWLDDPGVQQELGQQPVGKDYASNVNPGADKPTLFKVVDYIPTSFLGFDACGLISDISGLPIIKQALGLFKDATDLAFHSFHLQSPEKYVQMAVDYFSNGAVNTLAQGAERGGYMNKGARLAANNQFQAMGGRELTDAEAKQVKQTAYLDQQQTLADASFYDKFLNVHTSTSLLSSAILHAPTSMTQLASDIGNFPSLFGNLASTIFGGSKAQAVVPAYNYGFPLYGYSEAEQNDPAYDDPFANEDYMLEGDRLDRMNTDYGDVCFGMQVAKDGTLTYGPSKDFTKIPDKCKDTSNTELTHYRFYLADIINGHGLACYEGEQDSCDQLNGNGTTAPPVQSIPAAVPPLAKQVLDLNQQGKILLSPGADADIQAAANGQQVTPGPIQQGTNANGTGPCTAQTPVYLDANLLQIMINIAKLPSYQSFLVQDITSTYKCDTGPHPLGRAFDIYKVNKTNITWNGANASLDRKFATDVIDVVSKQLPNGSKQNGNMGGIGVGDATCLAAPIAHPANINYFVDSCSLLHVDVGDPTP